MKLKLLPLLVLLIMTRNALFASAPTISVFSPAAAAIGTTVKITGTNLSGVTSVIIGGKPAIVISNTATQVVAMVMPGAVTGAVTVTTGGGSVSGPNNFTVTPTLYPDNQIAKLTGTGGTHNAQQGKSVALSADGTTAIVAGWLDSAGAVSNVGSVWIYILSGGHWVQQGPKLRGSPVIGQSYQGGSVAISGNGSTVIVGAPIDNSDAGAAWIFTRSSGVWTQQTKLTVTDNVGPAGFGLAVSLSADGNTAIIGGDGDNNNTGAAWVFTQSHNTWSEYAKITLPGAATGQLFGNELALSADGKTFVAGTSAYNSFVGAAWVFGNTGGVWSLQSGPLAGNDANGNSNQGAAVAVSADGNILAEGGRNDNGGQGAVWVFKRNGSNWLQQGNKLVGTGGASTALQGIGLSMSADGNTILDLGVGDNGALGATWVFNNSGSGWMQKGSKLVSAGFTANGAEGSANSVAISANGTATFVGGVRDNNIGAAFVYNYVYIPPPVINSMSLTSGPVGTLVTINGTGLSNPTSVTIAGKAAIVVSNTGTRLVAMVMPGATTGNIIVVTNGGMATSAGAFTVTPTPHPGAQDGHKLVGTNFALPPSAEGNSVCVSADGLTAIVGGSLDNTGQGGAWIFIKSAGNWIQQGPKMVGAGGSADAGQGYAVAINADGNTAVVGGYKDAGGIGAMWVYTRTGTAWSPQGGKLTPPGTSQVNFGASVGISADGNTIVSGGYNDNTGVGAGWVYTRAGNTWSPQSKLLLQGNNIGTANAGGAVAISQDGNTIALGGSIDNNLQGAVWVFSRSGAIWLQQAKLVATDNIGPGGATQGTSVALSADGNTLMYGGLRDDNLNGAAWVYMRSGNTWTEQAKLVGTSNFGPAKQGSSVALSADGNTAMAGGYLDSQGLGALWVYTRSGFSWTQQYTKLTARDHAGQSAVGSSLSLAATGAVAITGGSSDGGVNGIGAAWVYIPGNPVPSITTFTPPSGPIGTLVTINGTNLENPTAFTIGGTPAIVVSNTGSQLVGLVMPGTVSGAISVTTAYGTAMATGNFTVTPTLYPSFQQHHKLVGSGFSGTPQEGHAVALSADGNTALVGGYADAGNMGAAWIFTRVAGNWLPQTKLVGLGAILTPNQGNAVALSADGNTAIIGGVNDNNGEGAAWIFTRLGATWDAGTKIIGPNGFNIPGQGSSVAMSADGNTAAIGGPTDSGNLGAFWVFTRSGRFWTPLSQKFTPNDEALGANFGTSLAMSADGKTIAIGGPFDNTSVGAVWIFVKGGGGGWAQQGSKLVGTGDTEGSLQGSSVSLSADGNTLAFGGNGDNGNQGAVWVFTRGGTTWIQQGEKLTGIGVAGDARFGSSIGISADGNTLFTGAPDDATNNGASWVFTRSGSAWTQQGGKILSTDNTGNAIHLGFSTALSLDGTTGMAGGPQDNAGRGAAWAYIIDTRQVQTITFPPLAAVVYGTVSNIDPSASASSGLPITYTSSNGNVATIQAGMIHILAAGNSIITASQAGDGTHKDATPVAQPLKVNKATLTVTADDKSRPYGQENPGLTVSYSGFASGDGPGSLITQAHASCNAMSLAPVGTYPIIAVGGASNNYNFTYVQGTLTVDKANQTITFNNIPTQHAGTTFDLSTLTTSSSGLPVSFSSSNHAVATTSGTTLNSLSVGTSNITASQTGNANYNAATSIVQPLTVIAPGPGNIFVHQGISANGDGLNDKLTIDGIGVYPDNALKIIDRNGALIFEAKGYDNNTRVFNGHSSKTGQKVQSGTYFYSLDYKVAGLNYHQTGFVLLKY